MPTRLLPVRTGFRLAAIVPTLMLLAMGGTMIVIGWGAVGRADYSGLIGVVVGTALTTLGVLLGRVVVTGLAPANSYAAGPNEQDRTPDD